MEKKYGSFTSSVNPQELSLTVTAIARLVLSMLVTFGYVTATGADTTIEQVPVIVGTGYAVVQALEALWGGVRKIIVAVTEK